MNKFAEVLLVAMSVTVTVGTNIIISQLNTIIQLLEAAK